MSERLKGQESLVRLIKSGSVVEELTDIQSAEFDFDLTLLSEGYLNERSDRKDDIFNGCSGSISMHIESRLYLNFISDIVTRAQRKVTMFKVDLITVLQFTDAESAKILFPDIRFGNFKQQISGRAGYTGLSLDWGSSTFQRLS